MLFYFYKLGYNKLYKLFNNKNLILYFYNKIIFYIKKNKNY